MTKKTTQRLDASRLEQKRKHDREAIARKRASMTPEVRAEVRRDHDAAYREKHRERRRQYDRDRLRQLRGQPGEAS